MGWPEACENYDVTDIFRTLEHKKKKKLLDLEQIQ